MHKILVVEDSEDSFSLIGQALGPTVELVWAKNIAEAKQELKGNSFDLILLDVMLPDGDGFEFSSVIQGDNSLQSVPIIFITARGSVSDKVTGFSAGAEDYISKPFNLLELRARIQAKLRRQEIMRKKTNDIRLGDIRVDLTTQSAYVKEGQHESEIDLTPIEYKILALLIREPKKVFSRDEILDTIWGQDVHVYSRSVDTHVSKLRKKLGLAGDYVESVHGSGYKIRIPETNERSSTPYSYMSVEEQGEAEYATPVLPT